jgi:F-type H+-transporting ATPase subunit b
MRIVTAAAIMVLLLLCGPAPASPEAPPAASASEPSIFDGTWADALWTVIAFVALAAVLGRFAWKPLLKALQQREDHIRKELTDAETKRREAERLLDEHKLQAQAILEYIAEEAQKLERETLEKARVEASAIREKAQSNVEEARAVVARQLWEEAGDMLLAVGREVIGRAMTPQDNRRLIEEALERLRQEQSGGKK